MEEIRDRSYLKHGEGRTSALGERVPSNAATAPGNGPRLTRKHPTILLFPLVMQIALALIMLVIAPSLTRRGFL